MLPLDFHIIRDLTQFDSDTQFHQQKIWCSSNFIASDFSLSLSFKFPHDSLILLDLPREFNHFPNPLSTHNTAAYSIILAKFRTGGWECDDLHYIAHAKGPSTSGKGTACNAGNIRNFLLWVRKIPGRRQGNPLQYSCLENLIDRGAWLATVHSNAVLDTTEATWHTDPREYYWLFWNLLLDLSTLFKLQEDGSFWSA